MIQDQHPWDAHTFEIRGPAGRRLVQVAIAARATTAAQEVSLHLGSLLVRELGDVALAAVSNVRWRGDVTREKHSSDLDVISLVLEWDCPGAFFSVAQQAGTRRPCDMMAMTTMFHKNFSNHRSKRGHRSMR